ncbi:DNA polymerase III subunit beta [Paraburkholderia kururiensis]|uniref:DNA polymerase III subunit beta n=1 Tax=Paraburkholderia kururiensis TaxID=984307 RepID=UPI0005A994C3|nr:DNA polymerase III subunit beta [Paraburkholderia kururiensis]
MKINATASAFKALQIIAPRDDIRYYLNGVYVEAKAGETRLVATDGHRLAVYRIECNNDVPDGQAVSLIVPNSVIERLRVSRTSPDEVEIGWLDDGRAYVSHDDVRIAFTPTEGKFPDYRKVIPRTFTNTPGNYNPSYLADFQKVGAALKRQRGLSNVYVAMRQNGESGALVTVAGLDNFAGVVMPQRIGDSPSVAWATMQ